MLIGARKVISAGSIRRRLYFALAVLLAGALLIGPAAAQEAPTDEDLMLEFVRIPAGSFAMGSPESEYNRGADETRRTVTISQPFYLAAREVTQYQWQTVMGYNPSYLYDCPLCPVEMVNWHEAIVFCNSLSTALGLSPAYVVVDSTVTWKRSADGFRLPTEAEWEYAYRAGTTAVFGGTDCLSADAANYNGYLPYEGCEADLFRCQTVPVGSFAPNPWGLHDMEGNVSEWCWDWYGALVSGPVFDPVGPSDGRRRVQRGGAFNSSARFCRAAYRSQRDPLQKGLYRGLRLAQSLAPAGVDEVSQTERSP